MENKIVLSTDTLNGYGLDRIFAMAKEVWCDWIDLAIRKNYDTRHDTYVKKLSDQYGLSIEIIQTSNKINAKELNQAVILCTTTWCKNIAINAPSYFDVKAYSFLTNNISSYQSQYPDIKFSIVSPDTSSMSYLPLPKYRFWNLADIIKKYKCWLALDISVIDEWIIDNFVMIKMPTLAEHIPICYISDRSKNEIHLIPWEGNVNIPSLFKTLYKQKYKWCFGIKLSLDPQTLINDEKVSLLLKRTIQYIKDHNKNN